MTPNDLEPVIVEPAERAGVVVEPAQLARLVADAAERPGHAAALDRKGRACHLSDRIAPCRSRWSP